MEYYEMDINELHKLVIANQLALIGECDTVFRQMTEDTIQFLKNVIEFRLNFG